MATSRGALLELIAKGDLDEYLFTNDLKYSMFRNSFRKITNFSEHHTSIYSGSNTDWGGTLKFKIGRYGDLLNQMYLVMKLPEVSVEDIVGESEQIFSSDFRVKWKDYIGNIIVENVKLKIGGQLIDEHTGEYLQMFTDLYDMSWSKLNMIGHNKSMIVPTTKIDSYYLYIPLRFWFCNDIRKSLPLIALEYSDVEVEIKLRKWDEVYHVLKTVDEYFGATSGNTVRKSTKNFAHTTKKLSKKSFTDVYLECNFIYLDAEERVVTTKMKHELVIMQTQNMRVTCNKLNNIKLNFNHSVREMFFAIQNIDYVNNLGEIFNYCGKPKYLPSDKTEVTDFLWAQIPNRHLLDKGSLVFEGIEKVKDKDFNFWHYVQNYEHYRNTLYHNYYMYSFGADKMSNSGSCNFSRIDNIELRFSLRDSKVEPISFIDGSSDTITVGPGTNPIVSIYVNNYNVFVIEGGMGGLMFSC
uniref:Major capsid protein n=1 Tax=Megaviridae environmental sample TaxID=1737588 RepID=A0A5J6VK85_9VIRU|nr:MAG: major capsid protein [Megaviridae environmental sample]